MLPFLTNCNTRKPLYYILLFIMTHNHNITINKCFNMILRKKKVSLFILKCCVHVASNKQLLWYQLGDTSMLDADWLQSFLTDPRTTLEIEYLEFL